MDPALWELLRDEVNADRGQVIEAIIRLVHPGIEIPGVRIVSRFGAIATCRIPVRDVVAVRARSDVVSLKAARRLSPGFAPESHRPDTFSPVRVTDLRRSPGLALTGMGVVVAAVDWGVDVDAASFRLPPDPAASDDGALPGGATRFLSFWDQRDSAVGLNPEPYGYGAVHDRDEINQALRDPRPYERLGYHPAIADRGTGTHGTHVLDIAAGNGRGGGPLGVAPKADLVFVHLADRDTGGLANLGDSVRLLEAVDFIAQTAGSRPWVINISVGRHGGPHDGTTLTELAFDALLAGAPGRFIVQSTGNYYRSRTHAAGRLALGETQSFSFVSDPADATPNELEIWYDAADKFAVHIDPPGHRGARPLELGERSDLMIDGDVVGRVYHRACEPNNGDNHIDAFLYPIGSAGTWTVTLEARRVVSGRFDAWLERDDACPPCQARFTQNVSSRSTTGTIANGHLPLVVGAYNGHQLARPVASFSSVGPTRDCRGKPDLVAPGVDVLAARSAAIGTSRSAGRLVRKSGTSMATPHVTGAVALCLELATRLIDAREIRSLVLSSCDQPRSPDPQHRLGRGYLNISRLILEVRRTLTSRKAASGTKEPIMNTDDTMLFLAAAPATAYREYVYRPDGLLARWIDDRYEVVARPGQRVDREPQQGDLLLDVTLGKANSGRCFVLEGSQLDRVNSRPRLSHGQLLLRPISQVDMSDPSPVEPPGDTEDTDPDVAAFREAVLASHIERSRRRKGTPARDLSNSELSTVTGTKIKMAPAAASRAGDLLQAANQALDQARANGNPDVGPTLRITAVSGYRGRDHQARLWRHYFERYYQETREAREGLSGGPHGEAAVRYMLDVFRIPARIAAPGFSNHQAGIAIDFIQVLRGRDRIRNSTNKAAVARWRSTWVYRWLEQNAASFGFAPYVKEPWHWEFRLDQAPAGHGSTDAEADGGIKADGGTGGGALGESLADALPRPLVQQCGFVSLSGSLLSEATVCRAVVDVALAEQDLWRKAGALRRENVGAIFGHLARYWLNARRQIPMSNLLSIADRATDPTTVYGHLLGAATTPAADVARDAQRVAQDLLVGIPASGTPANIEALVVEALLDARRARLDQWAWSGVFVNSCVRIAEFNLNLEAHNAEGAETLLSLSRFGRHWEYTRAAHIRRFGCRRPDGSFDVSCQRDGSYHAFELSERPVQMGDIVVQDRQAAQPADVLQLARIQSTTGAREMHGDIVVDVQPNYADTIGGNVGHAVRRRRYLLGPGRHILAVANQRFVQESDLGLMPPLPAPTGAPLHPQSAGRVFALLSPIEACTT